MTNKNSEKIHLINDSKIKNLQIELPHYRYSHSSSEEALENFVGRNKLFNKLRKLVETSTEKTGVYLVAGNRGVGKTSLINHVINHTSLRPNSIFSKYLKYSLIILFSVAVIQFIIKELFTSVPISLLLVIFIIFFLIFFLLISFFNGYWVIISYPHNEKFIILKKCLRICRLGFQVLIALKKPYDPFRKWIFLFRIILIVISALIISEIFSTKISAIDALIYTCLPVIVFRTFYLIEERFAKERREFKADNILEHFSYIDSLINMIKLPILFIMKSYNRLYLRINFGNKLKDEKDILRLIVSTLNTEYYKYHHSFRRLFIWRITTFGLLYFLSYSFSNIIEERKFYKPIKDSQFYKTSTQVFFDSIYVKDNDVYIEKNKERLNEVFQKYSLFSKTERFFLIIDDIVYEISKRVRKIPQILSKPDIINFDGEYTPPIDYLFWLSFFVLYLFFVLVSRCSWFSNNFVTHRTIRQQLKRLNSDITNSTERENSININQVSGTGIGTRTKKTRNIADAREIEKELQDILNNMQRIPSILCRPVIVIVFDELDKVESEETDLEKEKQKKKSLLLSIDSTRERQNEILKILSNMKYFLSTANAKFLFIAGCEMYDMYLADVSDRNHHFGSIFNEVIYVPSFLKYSPEEKHTNMTSMTEEFVCQRLIPHDYYPGKPRNLTLFQEYLDIEIYELEKIRRKQLDENETLKIRKKIIDLQLIINTKKDYIVDIYIKKKDREIISDIRIPKTTKKLKSIVSHLDNEIDEILQEIINIVTEERKQNDEIVEKIQNYKTKIKLNNKLLLKELIEIIKKDKEIEQQYITDPSSYLEALKDLINNLQKKIEQDIIAELINESELRKAKIIAVLQQFIIYLAHVSKGAPKKMMQLFESFVEVEENVEILHDNSLSVKRYKSSRFFLYFDYIRQHSLGFIAYLITPIFNRLSEGNSKEYSDKLLVSSLRFVDFLFKFHRFPFSWKHLDMSPEILEVNRAPELKSVAVDLLNYLMQVHINKSSFNLSDYKFDSLIVNDFFVMTRTNEVFSALFNFTLDETLPLKNHYQVLLEKTQKEYQDNKNSPEFIDAVSSLQVVLGDLNYFDDELEEAGMYYNNAVQMLRRVKPRIDDKNNNEEVDNETMSLEQLYLYVRNMLKLGLIHEKRKQYDFAYLTYGELCKRIIRERNISIEKLSVGVVLRSINKEDKVEEASTILDANKEDKVVFVKAKKLGKNKKEEKKYYDNIEVRPKEKNDDIVLSSIATPQPLYFKNISPNTNDILFEKMTYEGLKQLYLPFLAKLQILEKSHVGGITRNHLEQLDKEFKFLTFVIDHEEANILESDFFSRVADILYYKNSDLKCKKFKRITDEDNGKSSEDKEQPTNCSCTACHYYHKALYTLLKEKENEIKNENTPVNILLKESVKQINIKYNMKYCTLLARILSEWGNVFFSCDNRRENENCYICNTDDCKITKKEIGLNILNEYIDYVISDSSENIKTLLNKLSNKNFSKIEISFVMYAISLQAYNKASLFKLSAYQIYKMLRIFKNYELYKKYSIKLLSEKSIQYLWFAAEGLNVFELNKRQKDLYNNTTILSESESKPLQDLLVISEISRINIMVKELELNLSKNYTAKNKKLKEYYRLYITVPYGINYSITTRIQQLRLKAIINYEVFRKLIIGELSKEPSDLQDFSNTKISNLKQKVEFVFDDDNCKNEIDNIFDIFILEEVIKEVRKLSPKKIKEMKCKNREELIAKKICERKSEIMERIIAESIFCLKEIILLSKTIGEKYLSNHSFMASMHEKLAYWLRLYEAYKSILMTPKYEHLEKKSNLDRYLKRCLGKEWNEQLSSYYEEQQALSHYYKCIETHNEGKAYFQMIDRMCYFNDDYNESSVHFSIAEERHKISNGEIENKIKEFKIRCEDSELHKVDNYFASIKM